MMMREREDGYRMSKLRLCTSTLAAMAALLSVPGSIMDAAPPAIDCRGSGITSPLAGATVSGNVEIRGRAVVTDFRFYKVEFSPIGRESWLLIGPDVIRTSVEQGLLVVWRTNLFPDGAYRLRLHVVDPAGNYCEVLLSPIYVANGLRPTETATATPTETVLLSVVPPQRTPTIPPTVSIEVAPPPQTPGVPSGRGQPLPDFNLLVFGACFGLGACAMLSIALIVGAVMFVLNKTDQDA